MGMAVYDCFTFFNELDILELRLEELDGCVDYFVLGEATRTFSSQPKPLYFAENKQRFARFLPKIIHVVIDDLPAAGDAWDREAFQRDALSRGLDAARPDDVIMISDVDEIPFPSNVARLTRAATQGHIWFIECDYYTYKLNLAIENKWVGLCAIRAIQRRYLPGMQSFRGFRARQSRRLPMPINQLINVAKNVFRVGRPLAHVLVEHGGWHFTFMNTPDNIRYKIASYAHQERNTPEFNSLENIQRLIAEGRSVCGRNLRRVGLEQMPRTVREDQRRWQHLLDERQPAVIVGTAAAE
jgi:beta-1,4-mannosyl-glycoprotein beta-1,4-N-acetylglucosaminyltransferase